MEKSETYAPKGSHSNFVVSKEEFIEKEKPRDRIFRYINANNELVGKYINKNVFWAARKILTRIYQKNGERNPIFEVYDEENDMIYKYAGEVKPIKPKIQYIEDEKNDTVIKIVRKNKYTINQISKQKRKIPENE